MSFMQPQIVELSEVAEYIDWENENGEGFARSETYTVAWRLSAPGFMDCTEWTPADSIAEAITEMLGQHGDTFDVSDLETLGSELEGFEEFKRGYLLGLAFTGNRYLSDNDSDDETEEPLFHAPGADISDIVDPETDVWDKLSDEHKLAILNDCVSFLCDALPYLGESPDFETAGSDFHLTRNGHGAGFWDGDWENGDKLTELSEPYGTAELCAYGRHIDTFEREGFEGTDLCLETSFFEYGLMWSEVDSDGDRKYVYGAEYVERKGRGAEPTKYRFAWIAENVDILAEFNWLKLSDFSPLGIETQEQLSEWLTLPTPRKIADLVSLVGTENVFGTDYAEALPIVCDDTDTFDIQG